MYLVPEVGAAGIQQIDYVLPQVTINEMWQQVKIYQPGITLFLSALIKEDGVLDRDKERLVIVAWYCLQAIHGQVVVDGQKYRDRYDALLDMWGITVPAELEQVNLATVADDNYLKSADFLIETVGQEDAMPIIEAAGRSVNPDLLMGCVYYTIALMNKKSRERNTQVSSN